MNIIVCIKQVPGTNKVEVDPITGVLKREGVESKLNPYDLFALEQAFVLTEKYGGSVKVITMGPPQAKAALLEAIYMGAESGVLVTDRKFGGADVVATSYTISQGISKMGQYDLIICGKQTTDGDTAQVGPETAEFLGIGHAANVCSIVEIKDNYITMDINLDNSIQRQKTKLPCLIAVDKDINTPRLPSYKRKISIKENVISVLTLKDMEDSDEKNYGLKGSPTQVERIFPPEKNQNKQLFEGNSADLSAQLFNLLKNNKFI